MFVHVYAKYLVVLTRQTISYYEIIMKYHPEVLYAKYEETYGCFKE